MTNYKILLPPSEGKLSGGNEQYFEIKNNHSFAILEKNRVFLLQNLLDFISHANDSDLEKLFSVKNNFEQITAFFQDFDNKLTLPAINRYSGVMFNAIDYPSLNEEQKNNANQSILFIDALFGLLQPQDLIPNYKLSISAKFADFKIDNYWKKNLKEILEEELQGKIILDILPQAHRKAIAISNKNCYLINFFEIKNGKAKNAGHISKKLKGEFIRYILSFDEINLEILYNFSHSQGYKYSEDLSSDNEVIFLKS
jgi:cytoplasmic iron level regulating protein YaaA (DUF328/UPF0246 family)